MADDARKRRWITAAVAVSIVVVIAAWIGYMNAEIAPLVGPSDTSTTVPAASGAALPEASGVPSSNGDGLLKTFERGVQRIVNWAGAEISYVVDGVRNAVQGKSYEYQFDNGGQGK